MAVLHLLTVTLTLVTLVESQIQEGLLAANTAGLCLCAGLDGFNRLNLPLYRNSVRFTLYTRSSNANGQNIALGDVSSLRSSSFNPRLPLKVITHGWWEQNKATWMIKMKDAFLTKEDANVVLVDWSPLAIGQSYAIAANSAQYVGRIIAEFLQFLQTNSQGFTPKQVHLVGFSMGSHISGIAGRNYPGIDRITGLDPAGPVFECLPGRDERLTPDDADFVDIIHTNDGCQVLGVTGIGHKTPTGHQDFYVNGGAIQPGCPAFEQDLITSISNLDLLEGKGYICHHHRATDYFTESILASAPAIGFQCQNYLIFKAGACLGNRRTAMGYPASRDARGIFFLTTREQPNFLVRYISITVNGLNRNIPGRLGLVFTGPNGTPLQTIILSDGLLTRTNSGTLALPVSMSINDVNVDLRYEPLNIFQTGTNFLDALTVNGADVITNERYCVSNRQTTSPTIRRIKLGTCKD